jgi:hypothetical protein
VCDGDGDGDGVDVGVGVDGGRKENIVKENAILEKLL